MDFEYYLLTNQDGPLASREIHDLSELNQYVEILHDDFQLPGEDGGDGIRWHVNDRRRVHVYERCSQFSILQRMPTAYMWASPGGHWSSSIWCSKSARPSTRRCGM